MTRRNVYVVGRCDGTAALAESDEATGGLLDDWGQVIGRLDRLMSRGRALESLFGNLADADDPLGDLRAQGRELAEQARCLWAAIEELG